MVTGFAQSLSSRLIDAILSSDFVWLVLVPSRVLCLGGAQLRAITRRGQRCSGLRRRSGVMPANRNPGERVRTVSPTSPYLLGLRLVSPCPESLSVFGRGAVEGDHMEGTGVQWTSSPPWRHPSQPKPRRKEKAVSPTSPYKTDTSFARGRTRTSRSRLTLDLNLLHLGKEETRLGLGHGTRWLPESPGSRSESGTVFCGAKGSAL